MSLERNTSWKFERSPFWVGFFLFLPFVAAGDIPSVMVQLSSEKVREVVPGKVIICAFQVSNNSGVDEALHEEIILPVGWRKISPIETQFMAEANDSVVRMIAVAVPSSTPANQFEISYSVQRKEGEADSVSFTVKVLPIKKLELLVVDKPEMVIAGEEYGVMLRVLNRGNVNTKVKTTITNTPDYYVKAEPLNFSVGTGSYQDIRIVVKTNESIKKRISHFLSVKVDGGINLPDRADGLNKTISVEVIPRVTTEIDPYHRLPVRLRFIAGMDDGKDMGFQTELSGRGYLDEAREKGVSFLFRGPSLQNTRFLGTINEYRIGYFSKGFDFNIGDRNYSLSHLTERFGYGRGLELNVRHKNISAGSFYMKSRWGESNSSTFGTYVSRRINNSFEIKANYLRKRRSLDLSSKKVHDNIYSIESRYNPGKLLDLDLEFGFSNTDIFEGKKAFAFRAEVKGELFKKLRYSIEKLYAEPMFAGSYRDTDALFTRIELSITKKLRGTFSFRQHDGNLELDLGVSGVANSVEQYQGRIYYKFPEKTEVFMGYEYLQKHDRLLPRDFHFEEKSVKLGVSHRFNRLSFQAFAEIGQGRDNLTSNTFNTFGRYSLYTYYRPSQRQTYALFATVGPSQFTGIPDKTLTVGASASLRFSDSMSLDMQYSRTEQTENKKQVRDSFNASIKYSFKNRSNLILAARWSKNSFTNNPDSSIFLIYSIPLNLPLWKKKNLGSIKGRILDLEDAEHKPLPRVLITANNATAISDEKGEFIFPSLKPGVYVLQVAQKTIGTNRITTERLPLMIEIEAKSTAYVEIGVVNSSSVTAEVSVFGRAANSFKGSHDQTLTTQSALSIDNSILVNRASVSR